MKYVTGDTIKSLREAKGLTQKELADSIFVSDKTISKWETNRGLPDIKIIERLASALSVSVSELLTGEMKKNKNVSANMKRLNLYVCPICGNVITAIGDANISCCGITLPKLIAEDVDQSHNIDVSYVEDEYSVSVSHEMSKEHYISFLCYVTTDSIETKKLYPEQDAQARFKRKGSGIIFAYCNIHGLYMLKV